MVQEILGEVESTIRIGVFFPWETHEQVVVSPRTLLHLSLPPYVAFYLVFVLYYPDMAA